MICNMCPRNCNRERDRGYCRAPEGFLVSRIAPHPYEEPSISGNRGSGTVFFGGCNLHCVYCQNRAISRSGIGELLSEDELEKQIFALAETGVHNINFVTPTHYTLPLARLLERVKPQLHIPIVWNSGGYESVDSLRMLDGLVDIYLPDFKYADATLAKEYSFAPDYPKIAISAIKEMYRQRGKVTFDGDIMTSGLLVRHLVLPSHRQNSMDALSMIAEALPVSDIRLSLMSQFTPDFVEKGYPKLMRRVTSFEYGKVLDYAVALGYEGYLQSRESAKKKYTPEF